MATHAWRHNSDTRPSRNQSYEIGLTTAQSMPGTKPARVPSETMGLGGEPSTTILLNQCNSQPHFIY